MPERGCVAAVAAVLGATADAVTNCAGVGCGTAAGEPVKRFVFGSVVWRSADEVSPPIGVAYICTAADVSSPPEIGVAGVIVVVVTVVGVGKGGGGGVDIATESQIEEDTDGQ